MKELSGEICADLKTLLVDFSSLHEDDSGFGEMGNHFWGALGREGCTLQSKAHEVYERIFQLLSFLLRNQRQEVLNMLYAGDLIIRQAVEQSGHTWYESTRKVYGAAVEAFERSVGLLEELYDPSDGDAVYVPDIQALVANADLASWRFPDIGRFTLFLTPTVLSGLENLSAAENSRAQPAAERLIRMVKAYRSEGRITDGVTLVEGTSTLIAGAVEPDFENTLPWLRTTHDDDRILASFLEVLRRYPRSPVVLVTANINLQTKAEFCWLQYTEPPGL